MKKRTKQVETMVAEINLILKNNRVIDDYKSDIFWTMQHLLLKTETYAGYNWFWEDKYTDILGQETTVERLVGSSDPKVIKNKNGYLQFY